MGILNFARAMLTDYAAGGGGLINAQLAITKRCNLDCPFCHQGRTKTDILSLDDIRALVDELHGLGVRRMTLTGGEPLVRLDLRDILRHIKSKGMSVSLASNGLLVPKRIDDIRELDLITVSYKGTTGIPTEMMPIIDALRQAGIKTQICAVLTRDLCTVERVKGFLDFCRQNDVTVSFIPFYTSSWFTAGKRRPDVDYSQTTEHELAQIPEREPFEQVIRYLISAGERGDPMGISKASYRGCLGWPDATKTALTADEFTGCGVSAPSRCHAGRRFVMIDDDGMVLPCWSFRDIHGQALNRNERPLKECLAAIADHSCRACINLGFMELNNIFDLTPATVMHYLRNRRRFG
jgi:MoaA/NifB/PqqE/SkfB family radical SAM enzyme